MENNKYLIVSMTDTHAELLQAIRNNARKRKVSVSQYVRTLLYNAIDLADESGKTPTRMDDTRAEGTMGSGIWQSA
jgi:hypothetical protein